MKQKQGRGLRRPDWLWIVNEDGDVLPFGWAVLGLLTVAVVFIMSAVCRVLKVPWQYLYMLLSVVVVVVGFRQFRQRLDETNRKWLPYYFAIAILVVGAVIIACVPPPGWGPKRQTPKQLQQAAAPEQQTAEPQQAEAVPEIDPRDLRTVLAHNEAMQLVQVAEEGGPVDLREQVNGQSAAQEDELTSSTDEEVQDLRKFVPGKADEGSKNDKKDTSQSKKSIDWTLVVGLTLVVVLVILCFAEKTRDGARTIATILIGFVVGYGLIWLIFGQGKLALIVGLIGALIFYRLHQGLDLPDLVGGAGRVVGKFKAQESVHGNDHQPPLNPGGTSGGNS